MKKVFTILYICMLLLLTGCSKSGTVLTAYRNTASLKVIQTVGIDPGMRLTVSSGGAGENDDTVLLSAEAQSLGQCMERLQDYATDSELFYSHLQYILISDTSARDGIDPILDYIERSVDIRMKTALFIVRGSAGDLMTGAGNGNYDLSRVLSSLLADVNARGRTRIYTCAETARNIAQYGGGLICALRAEQREGTVYSGEDEGTLTAVPDGFGVLQGDKLVDYIPSEKTSVVCALTGKPGAGFISLECGGFRSTVQLSQCSVEYEPVYENGKITRVNVNVDISALLTETDNPEEAQQSDFLDALGETLSQRIESDAEDVFALYSEYGCDFLAIGPELRAKGAAAFDRSDWYRSCKSVQFHVTAGGTIVRTYENGG